MSKPSQAPNIKAWEFTIGNYSHAPALELQDVSWSLELVTFLWDLVLPQLQHLAIDNTPLASTILRLMASSDAITSTKFLMAPMVSLYLIVFTLPVSPRFT